LRYVQTAAAVEGVQGREAVEAQSVKESSEYTGFEKKINDLYAACQGEVETEDDIKAKNKERFKKNAIAGAALGAAGAALGIGISKTALDIKYEKAENEAIKEWMEAVGEHIQCYLGGEELGSYGDTISIDIE
jgi:hypothetical protein